MSGRKRFRSVTLRSESVQHNPPGAEDRNGIGKLPETAVFIDGDWVLHSTKAAGVGVDYGHLASAMRDAWGHRTSIWFYVTTVGVKRPPSTLARSLKSADISIKPIASTRRGARLHSRIDTAMAVDMTALNAECDRLVLVSGDSDFAPVLHQARAAKRATVVVAFPLVAGRALLEAADRFVSLENLLSHATRSVPRRPQANRPAIARRTDNYFVRGARLEPYLVVRQLFMEAIRSVVIVDPYLDEQILMMVQGLPKAVTVHLITDRVPADFCTMVRKVRSDGWNVVVRQTKDFHDRFLRVDDQLWHSGHSFKDLGNKDSRLSQVRDRTTVKRFDARVLEILRDSRESCS